MYVIIIILYLQHCLVWFSVELSASAVCGLRSEQALCSETPKVVCGALCAAA